MKRFFIAVLVFTSIMTVGLWFATQDFAKAVEYHAALGKPDFIKENGTPVYWPYKYLLWHSRFYRIVPNVFNKTYTPVQISFIAATVLAAFSVKRRKVETSHGTAKWANEQDIKKAGLFDKEGVVLGKSANGAYLRHNGPEHIMTMAPTRTGKGVGIIIPTLLTWPHSVIVTDIKGENWGITAGFRKKNLNNKVIKLEPTAMDKSAARFNPFNEIRLETQKEVSDVQNITNIIVDPQGKGDLDHWKLSAQTLLVGAILHLKYVYRDKACFGTLVRFLSDPEKGSFLDILTDMMETEHDKEKKGIFREIYGEDDYKHPIVLQIATEMYNKPEKELGSIVSTAMAVLSIYRDPVLAYNTAASDFSVHDLMNYDQPVSLYMVVPPSDIDRMNPIFRLIIELIIRRSTEKMDFKQGAAVKAYKHRMLLLIDEFPALGRLDTFERAMAYIAGYGLKALLITQSLNQLNKIYTKDNSIIDNCQVRIFFTPNDVSTPEYITKMLGKMTEVVINKSTRVYELFHASKSTTNVARELMTSGEISLLAKDDELVFVSGCPPIKAKKIFYFNDKKFRDKPIDAPAKSDVLRQLNKNQTGERQSLSPKNKPLKRTLMLEQRDPAIQDDSPAESEENSFIEEKWLAEEEQLRNNRIVVQVDGLDNSEEI